MPSVLDDLAYYQGRRDEVPNQELARRLAERRDTAGIAEIAANLAHPSASVQSDCLKVLYEIGYLAPELVAEHVEALLSLLGSRRNRMIWGAMIGLATIADRQADVIWRRIEDVLAAFGSGTLITRVWGVRLLAKVAAERREYHERLWPILLAEVSKCGPRDVATHAESMLCAVGPEDRAELLAVVERRCPEMSASQRTRLRRVTRQLAPQ